MYVPLQDAVTVTQGVNTNYLRSDIDLTRGSLGRYYSRHFCTSASPTEKGNTQRPCWISDIINLTCRCILKRLNTK